MPKFLVLFSLLILSACTTSHFSPATVADLHKPSGLVLLRADGRDVSYDQFAFYLEYTQSPLLKLNPKEDSFEEAEFRESPTVRATIREILFYRELAAQYGTVERREIHDSIRPLVEAKLRALVQQPMGDFVTRNVTVSDEEVEAYYAQHPEEFMSQEKVRVAIVYRASSDDESYNREQRQLLEELLEREDISDRFSEYARQYSQSPSGPKGGNLGWVERGKLSEPLDEAVFAMEPGEVKGIIESPLGYYLVKVVDRKDEGKKSLEEVRPSLSSRLKRDARVQRFNEYVSELRERYDSAITPLHQYDEQQQTAIRAKDRNYSLEELVKAYPALAVLPDEDAYREEMRKIETLVLLYLAYLDHSSPDAILPRWKYDFAEDIWTGAIGLDEEFERQAGNMEEAARTYYEENKEAYHTLTEREIETLTLHVPNTIQGNLRLVAFEEARRAIHELFGIYREKKLSWNELVELAQQEHENAVVENQGFMAQYPESWDEPRTIANMFPGAISPPFRKEDGYAMLTVLSYGDYDIPSYDEVAERVRGVVRHLRKQEYRQQVEEQMFASMTLNYFPGMDGVSSQKEN